MNDSPSHSGSSASGTPAGDWLEVRGAAAPDQASALVTELADAMGGEVLSEGYGFRVPTLAALRRREGR